MHIVLNPSTQIRGGYPPKPAELHVELTREALQPLSEEQRVTLAEILSSSRHPSWTPLTGVDPDATTIDLLKLRIAEYAEACAEEARAEETRIAARQQREEEMARCRKEDAARIAARRETERLVIEEMEADDKSLLIPNVHNYMGEFRARVESVQEVRRARREAIRERLAAHLDEADPAGLRAARCRDGLWPEREQEQAICDALDRWAAKIDLVSRPKPIHHKHDRGCLGTTSVAPSDPTDGVDPVLYAAYRRALSDNSGDLEAPLTSASLVIDVQQINTSCDYCDGTPTTLLVIEVEARWLDICVTRGYVPC